LRDASTTLFDLFLTADISTGLFNFTYFMEFLTLCGKDTALLKHMVLIYNVISFALIGLGAIDASFFLGTRSGHGRP
jgi:DMSO reductase anchor subunit